MNEPKDRYSIQIKVCYWKSKHHIYDYHNTQRTQQSLYTIPIPMHTQSISLKRNHKDRMYILNKYQKQPITHQGQYGQENQLRITVRLDQNKAKFMFKASGQPSPGLVVKQLVNTNKEPKGYNLKVGNRITFGKVSYIVLQTRKNSEVQSLRSIVYRKKLESGQIKDCRICYDSSDTKTNPLIFMPCKCVGSCQLVHIKCLKDWLNQRIDTRDRQHAIMVKKVSCELCHEKLPLQICIDGVMHDIVSVPLPKVHDYLMLDRIGENNDSDLVIIKNIPLEGLTIGRDNNSFIKIADITVSRLHACIKYSNGEFVLFDENSRFGTTVYHNEGIEFDVGKTPKFIQIQQNLIRIRIKKLDKDSINEKQTTNFSENQKSVDCSVICNKKQREKETKQQQQKNPQKQQQLTAQKQEKPQNISQESQKMKLQKMLQKKMKKNKNDKKQDANN